MLSDDQTQYLQETMLHSNCVMLSLNQKFSAIIKKFVIKSSVTKLERCYQERGINDEYCL